MTDVDDTSCLTDRICPFGSLAIVCWQKVSARNFDEINPGILRTKKGRRFFGESVLNRYPAQTVAISPDSGRNASLIVTSRLYLTNVAMVVGGTTVESF